MLSFRPHTPNDYDQLLHIDDEGTGLLSQADRECLDALGDLLASKGATERFGVSLLHRHFATHDHELMVEEVDTAKRLTTLSPKLVSAQSVYPVNIRFATADAEPHGYEIIGLEFIADLDDVAPIGTADSELFDSTYALLARHGMLSRFGLRLVYDPLHLPNGLALLETCESAPRVLTCKVVPGRIGSSSRRSRLS